MKNPAKVLEALDDLSAVIKCLLDERAKMVAQIAVKDINWLGNQGMAHIAARIQSLEETNARLARDCDIARIQKIASRLESLESENKTLRELCLQALLEVEEYWTMCDPSAAARVQRVAQELRGAVGKETE